MALGEPVIYVSVNYRLNGEQRILWTSSTSYDPIAFGFAASQEIKAVGTGNLGLKDREWEPLPQIRH